MMRLFNAQINNSTFQLLILLKSLVSTVVKKPFIGVFFPILFLLQNSTPIVYKKPHIYTTFYLTFISTNKKNIEQTEIYSTHLIVIYLKVNICQ